VVDALSMMVHEMHVTTISMYELDLCDKILEISKLDHGYVKVNLQQGMSQQKIEGYELKDDGILMYTCRFYVQNDQELKYLLLSYMHKFLMLDTQATRSQLSQ
jgi:hypothetical protein